MAAERAGVPAVADVCEGFIAEANETAKLGGLPWLPVVNYPGHIDLYSLEQRNKYISELVGPRNAQALTQPIEKTAMGAMEPPETEIAFKGTFEEVNKYYKEKMWTDGLPIVPPTVEKVKEFLKYTDYAPDAILTRPIQPSYRQATTWWVAVNGVMAGCRPEYMPVLVAMTKAWGEPNFDAQDSSSTPGWAPITIISGPIKKELGINYRHNYGTPGYQSNTSIGRFWSFFKRNLAGIRVEPPTDMGTHGLNYFLIAGEDDERVHQYGWKTLGEEQGFTYGDNVVTTMSVTSVSAAPAEVGDTGTALMDRITGEIAEGQGAQWRLAGGTPNHAAGEISTKDLYGVYLFVLPDLVAKVLARDGFDKDKMTDYVFNNAKRTAVYMETRYYNPPGLGHYCKQVKAGRDWARKEFCESEDPNRLIPMFSYKSQIRFISGGDEARNRVQLFMNNGQQGAVTSMRIELPKNWNALMKASELPTLLNKFGGFY